MGKSTAKQFAVIFQVSSCNVFLHWTYLRPVVGFFKNKNKLILPNGNAVTCRGLIPQTFHIAGVDGVKVLSSISAKK
jgi:hypothetical protein